MGLEKNDRLGTMHTSGHRRSVGYKKISGFTPSFEALGRLLKKKSMMTKIRISHMSDFSCGETKVVTTRKVFLWLEKGP